MFTKMAAQRLDIVDVLRNDRIPSGDIKVSAEFELSFFTMPLGFVDDEYTQYRTPWEYFMRTYLDFISGKSYILYANYSLKQEKGLLHIFIRSKSVFEQMFHFKSKNNMY